MASQIKVIETIHLFSKLDELLIDLLKGMEEKDWNLPTFAGNWTIKDVAVHLLDGNLRSLSMLRDGYFGVSSGEINSYQDLLNYLNKLNHDWVNALQRLSPRIIIELLEQSGNQYTVLILRKKLHFQLPGQAKWNRKTGFILHENLPKNGIINNKSDMHSAAQNPCILLSSTFRI
jgi:hypothetical protein